MLVILSVIVGCLVSPAQIFWAVVPTVFGLMLLAGGEEN